MFKVVVAAGCVYELAALTPGRGRRPPTISHLCATGARHTSLEARLVAWMFAGGLAAHLLGLERLLRDRRASSG